MDHDFIRDLERAMQEEVAPLIPCKTTKGYTLRSEIPSSRLLRKYIRETIYWPSYIRKEEEYVYFFTGEDFIIWQCSLSPGPLLGLII